MRANKTSQAQLKPVPRHAFEEPPTGTAHLAPTHDLPDNPPATGAHFTVRIARDLLTQVHDYLQQFSRQAGTHLETGGMWLGEFERTDDAVSFTLRGFVEAGPKAVCAPSSVLFDSDYQSAVLQAVRLEQPAVGNMGCFHRHPGNLDTCSSGDRVADQEAVRESDTGALVFVIVTRAEGSSRDAGSLFLGELKLNFYVMAEETGFEYASVQPEIVEMPVVRVSPALTQLALTRGTAGRYDLAVLRGISGLKRLSVRLVGGEGAGLVWLRAQMRKSRSVMHIFIKADGALEAFTGSMRRPRAEFGGPWVAPEVGRHVWLSHLLLLMLERSPSNAAVRFGTHRSGLLQDKKRLVAEVRVMHEKFGDRAVLRCDKGHLFWDYTVQESGRRFPVHVRYPRHYPAEPPHIFSLLPLPHSPHQLVNDELCWVNHYSLRRDWNPARDTAAVAVHAAHRWFACLLVYLTLGEWPEGADDQPAHLL